jgi:hypothetical protein
MSDVPTDKARGPSDVTALLIEWRARDKGAVEKLVPLVHGELRRIAKRHMAGERPDHVLQATALVNEVYIRLVDIRRVEWQDRAHFFAMAARLMRRVLVDFARARNNQKRGGALHRVTFDQDLGCRQRHTRQPDCHRRRASGAVGAVRTKGPGRRIAVFWRVERRRNRRSATDFARDRDAGLEIRQELADARAVAQHGRPTG